MNPGQTEQGLKDQIDLRAIAWLKTKQKKLLGARLALQAIQERGLIAREFQPASSFADANWQSCTQGVIRELKMPTSDPKTVYDCRQRCAQLIRETEAHLSLGHDEQAAASEREFAAITRYLNEVLTHQGKLRQFPSTQTKNYQANMQAWYYLLRQAAEEDPAIQDYLKLHVRPGEAYAWAD